MTFVVDYYTRRRCGTNRLNGEKGMEPLYKADMEELMGRIRAHQSFDSERSYAWCPNGAASVREDEPRVRLQSPSLSELALLAVEDWNLSIDPKQIIEDGRPLIPNGE
jgi:hypothetical protein